MEEEKQTFGFRQRWFPSPEDAEELKGQRDEKKGRAYSSFEIPMIDFFGRWVRTLAVGGFLTWITLWGGCNLAFNNYEYSKGTRTGMINKFSERGLIWKTYEGQMALEGMVSGGSYAGANVWDFSLDRQRRHGENTEELTKEIQTYLESGTKVKVDYIEPLRTWPWRSGTNYLIQKVVPIKSKEEQ